MQLYLQGNEIKKNIHQMEYNIFLSNFYIISELSRRCRKKWFKVWQVMHFRLNQSVKKSADHQKCLLPFLPAKESIVMCHLLCILYIVWLCYNQFYFLHCHKDGSWANPNGTTRFLPFCLFSSIILRTLVVTTKCNGSCSHL